MAATSVGIQRRPQKKGSNEYGNYMAVLSMGAGEHRITLLGSSTRLKFYIDEGAPGDPDKHGSNEYGDSASSSEMRRPGGAELNSQLPLRS